MIVTALLDSAAQEQLTAWRERFFPSERNYLAAHVTLYHALPSAQEAWICRELHAAAAAELVAALALEAPRGGGSFVALPVVCPALQRLKQKLNGLFAALLTAQDRQPYRPHVTICNKGSAADGQLCLAQLRAEFRPFSAKLLGLRLYQYAGGPWTHLTDMAFSQPG